MLMSSPTKSMRPKQHFGRLHTPLHAFLELPSEQRSAVVWNTQIAALSKHIDYAKNAETFDMPAFVSKDTPLADPFYNHAWLTAYDALAGHPYQSKVRDLLAQWWSLEKHAAFDVVNQGIYKRLSVMPELLTLAMNYMNDVNRETLFLKIVKKQKFIHAVHFSEIMRVIVPVAENLNWTSDFTSNESLRNSSKDFDVKSFIEAMAARLTAFGRFNTHHLDLPVYKAEDGLATYMDVAEMHMLFEASKMHAPKIQTDIQVQTKHLESELELA